MWKERWKILFLAVVFAVYAGLMFVNPYTGTITLSELILQLSGSRGEFALGFSMPELLGYSLRMIPVYSMMMVFGNQLYRHFCTASVYVFSRCSDRMGWYRHTAASIFFNAGIFESLFVAVVILLTMFRYHVQVDFYGVVLVLYHIAVYSLWIFGWALLVNLLSIKMGNSFAVVSVIGVQMFFTAAFSVILFLKRNHCSESLIGWLIRVNPVSYTVTGWHKHLLWGTELQGSDYFIDPAASLILLLVFCGLVLWVSANRIRNCDIMSERESTYLYD